LLPYLDFPCPSKNKHGFMYFLINSCDLDASTSYKC
jgi:hypothetical protein